MVSITKVFSVLRTQRSNIFVLIFSALLYQEIMLSQGANYSYNNFYFVVIDEALHIGIPLILFLFLPFYYVLAQPNRFYSKFRAMMFLCMLCLALFVYQLYRTLLPWAAVKMALHQIDSSQIKSVQFIRDNCAENARFVDFSRCFSRQYWFQYELNDVEDYQNFISNFRKLVVVNSKRVFLFNTVTSKGWTGSRMYIDGLAAEERHRNLKFQPIDILSLEPKFQSRIP